MLEDIISHALEVVNNAALAIDLEENKPCLKTALDELIRDVETIQTPVGRPKLPIAEIAARANVEDIGLINQLS